MFHFTLRTEAQKEDTVTTETSHSDTVEGKWETDDRKWERKWKKHFRRWELKYLSPGPTVPLKENLTLTWIQMSYRIIFPSLLFYPFLRDYSWHCDYKEDLRPDFNCFKINTSLHSCI